MKTQIMSVLSTTTCILIVSTFKRYDRTLLSPNLTAILCYYNYMFINKQRLFDMDNKFEIKLEGSKQQKDSTLKLPTIPKPSVSSKKSDQEQGSFLKISDNQIKQKKDSNQLSEQNNMSANLDEEVNTSNKLQQFAEAWKSQSNISILLIEKLSLIVRNYFKVMNEIDQKNDQIGLLIVYNKSLYDILLKFQDQQKKLVHKLKTMEDFNMKAMRQLCILKKRQFTPIERKPQQLIFSKFSLKSLKYERPQKQCEHPDENYKAKIQTLFKIYLLQKNDHYLPQVRQKIAQRTAQLKQCQTNIHLQLENVIDDLRQLQQNIITYNKGLNDVNSQNMFDLYELKWQIKTQMKNLDMQIVENEDAVNKQRMFVNNVKSLHADLTNMKQGQLQNYLKKQKQIRKTIKKQRVKEQQIFLRTCEEAQNQNIELKQDIKKLKQKILQLEQELSHTKAQMQFRSMKKIMKPILDESIISDGEKIVSSKRLKEIQLRKLKQENQKLNKMLTEKNAEVQTYEREKKTIAERIKANGIQFQENTHIIELIQLVLYYYNKAIDIDDKIKEKKGHAHENKEQEMVSPKLDQHELFGFNQLTNAKFQKKPPHQKNSQSQKSKISTKSKQIYDQEYQNLRQQSQNLRQQLQEKDLKIQRLQSQKRLDTQTIRTLQQSIKILKQQIQDRLRQLRQKQPALLQKQAEIKELQLRLQKQISLKGQRIKELIKELQNMRAQYKKLSSGFQVLKREKQSAERLAVRITKAVETLVNQDISSDKFLLITDKMFQNLQAYVDQYNKETNRNLTFGTQFGVEGAIAQRNYDDIYSNYEYKTSRQMIVSKNQKSQKIVMLKNKDSQSFENVGSSISKSRTNQKQKNEQISKEQNKSISKQQKSNSYSRIIQPVIRKQGSIISNDSKKPAKKYHELGNQSQSMIIIQDSRRQKPKGKTKVENLIHQQEDQSRQSIQFKYDVQIPQNQKKSKQKTKIVTQLASPPSLPKRDKKQMIMISVEQQCRREYERMKCKGLRKKSQIKSLGSPKLMKEINQSACLFYEKQANNLASSGRNSKEEKQIGSSNKKLQQLRGFQPQKHKQKVQNIQRNDSDQKYQEDLSKGSSKINNNQSSIKLTNDQNKQQKQKKVTSQNYIEGKKRSLRLQEFIQNPHQNQSNLKSSKGKNSKKLNIQSNVQQQSVDLVISYEAQEAENHLKPVNQDKFKNTVLFSYIDNSAIDAEVQLKVVERIQEKIRRLYNDEDALDFYQLFNRYKQALKCLQRAEQLNKFLELRYQKFIEAVKHKQQVDPSYDIYERLLYLQRNVLEQQYQLAHQKDEFESSVIEQIKLSQKVIDEQLKRLRKEQKKTTQ